MEISVDTLSKNMPAPINTQITIKAKIICESADGALPETFLVEEDKSEIFIDELFSSFSHKKFNPILVASGINSEEFSNLIQSNQKYGQRFLYDQNNGQYWIIDFPSIHHESYSGGIGSRIFFGLETIFHAHSQLLIHGGSANFKGLQPDCSIYCLPELVISGYPYAPIIVVEVAWSQTSLSLESKIEKWRSYRIPYILGVDRNLSNDQLSIFMFDSDNAEPIIDIVTIADHSSMRIDFPFKKSLITKRTRLTDFLIDPVQNDFNITVNLLKF
jgi:hypothetical protein